MKFQKCLPNDFPKQSPRREDMKRGLEGRALEGRGFEKSREKGLLEEVSRYLPKEVTKNSLRRSFKGGLE
jgi:hypothetical protein